MEIKIYTTERCGYCKFAKEWFHNHNLSYQEKIVRTESDKTQFKLDCGPGVTSVPQIFIDGNRIGGYDKLLENKEKILKEIQ